MAERNCTACGVPAKRLRPETGYACKRCQALSEPVKNKNVCWLEKACNACGAIKPLPAFRRKIGAKDSRNSLCQECELPRHRERTRQRRIVKPQRVCNMTAEQIERRRIRDRERRKGVSRPWDKRVKEYVERAARKGKEYWPELYAGVVHDRARKRPKGSPQNGRSLWRLNAQQAWQYWLRERAPEWWLSSYYAEQGRPWTNPRLSDGEGYKLRYHADPAYRVRERMRRQFKKWLKGERKTAPSFLGSIDYTWQQLRSHIERQFLKGMSWDNAGEWHIDHIRPKTTFDPLVESEVRACWGLGNLRPAWKDVNHAKGARRLYLV